jgi:hypothetical protein
MESHMSYGIVTTASWYGVAFATGVVPYQYLSRPVTRPWASRHIEYL